MLAGFLLINLFLAYILNQISEAYKYRYELSLSEQMCKMYLDNFTEISHKYEESKRIIHDIKEHIKVADEMKGKDGNEYFSGVYKRMSELYGRFNCSNKILSVILNQKITQAKMLGIRVEIQVDDVPMGFMNGHSKIFCVKANPIKQKTACAAGVVRYFLLAAILPQSETVCAPQA